MPHMQWIDPSWSFDVCSPEEGNRRKEEMQGILDAINKLIGFDPNSASAKAEVQAQKNYSEAVTNAKWDYNRTMDKVLHEYHKARDIKGCDIEAIGRIYDVAERKAGQKCSKAEEQAWKQYKKASKEAEKLV